VPGPNRLGGMGELILPSGDGEIKLSMAKVDSEVASPSQRAVVIHTLIKSQLPHVTVWDIVCFCAEYLGTIVEIEPWIKPVVKHINKLVYIAHYYHGKGLESCVLSTGELKTLPSNYQSTPLESDTTKSKE
jgi:hypothetical protein